MLASMKLKTQPRNRSSKKKPYKPKIMYTDDGVAVTTLYLKSLGKEIKRDHLLNHFSTYGKVQNVRIYTKPTVSFGFVTFARAESAAKAMDAREHRIIGREIDVAVADTWHQEKQLEMSNNIRATKYKRNIPVPIELTNATGTHLLSLPDDCLYEIFSLKYLTVMDLCSLAESCVRMKDIATRIFATAHKSCNLMELSLKTIYEIRRLLKNFGSSITEMTMWSTYECNGCDDSDGLSLRVLDLVIRHCSKTLESLKLKDYAITELLAGKMRTMFSRLQKLHIEDGCIYGDGKQLFSKCKSLVELKVINLENDEIGMIFENHFPKLEIFKYEKEYDDYDDYNLELFVSRHKDLKAFTIKSYQDDCSSLLPVIALHCKDLEKLQITGTAHEDCRPFDYVNALMSLLQLEKLKKLKIKCDDVNVTKFIEALPQLNSLEFLELWHAQSDTQFIHALTQLGNLNVLRLRQCNNLNSLDALAQLVNLNELSVLIRGPTAITLDVVGMVKRLVNLTKLTVGLDSFKLDRRTYLKIVDVVRQRDRRSPSSSLHIKTFKIDDEVADMQNDGQNKEWVKLDRVTYYGADVSDSEYSDSDFDPYFMSDDDDDDDEYDDDDDYDFNPGALLFPFLPHHLFPNFVDSDLDSDEIDEHLEVW